MKNAKIICCNDSSIACITDEKIKVSKVMKKLKETDYKKKCKATYPTIEQYSEIYYWHVHIVPINENCI